MTPVKLSSVLKDVPTGLWAALNPSEDKVVATGSTLHEARENARKTGEDDPVLVKVSRTRLIT